MNYKCIHCVATQWLIPYEKLRIHWAYTINLESKEILMEETTNPQKGRFHRVAKTYINAHKNKCYWQSHWNEIRESVCFAFPHAFAGKACTVVQNNQVCDFWVVRLSICLFVCSFALLNNCWLAHSPPSSWKLNDYRSQYQAVLNYSGAAAAGPRRSSRIWHFIGAIHLHNTTQTRLGEG